MREATTIRGGDSIVHHCGRPGSARLGPQGAGQQPVPRCRHGCRAWGSSPTGRGRPAGRTTPHRHAPGPPVVILIPPTLLIKLYSGQDRAGWGGAGGARPVAERARCRAALPGLGLGLGSATRCFRMHVMRGLSLGLPGLSPGLPYGAAGGRRSAASPGKPANLAHLRVRAATPPYRVPSSDQWRTG